MESSQLRIEREHINTLFSLLKERGYETVGPKLGDGAIIYDTLESAEDLPIGWTDKHEAGKYTLEKREDNALFGYNTGAHTWKKFLHPPKVKLWSATKDENGMTIQEEIDNSPKYAFIGVRSCELHAILVQDITFLNDKYENTLYKRRRENCFIVAVNCGQANGTCFCVSMDTGPGVKSGFDVNLTEVIHPNEHYFIMEAGSAKGADILKAMPSRWAIAEEKEEVPKILARATAQMGREMDTNGIKELLYRNYENARWEDIADRCLTCGNCTMACPTCFCTTVDDVTDLTGNHAERWQEWDSCFTMDFSYTHGGTVRSSAKSRYRQWMTHKLATWIDQFGTSGCVGCGNCITWCPVGIDITEEVKAIRESEKKP